MAEQQQQQPTFATQAFGGMGIVAALYLFLTPLGVCYHVWRNKSIQKYSALPYLSQLVESTYWTLWAVLKGGREEMVINNGIGLVLMLAYTVLFAYFSCRSDTRRTIIWSQILITALGIASAFLVWQVADDPTQVLGFCAMGINIVKFVSPLAVVRMVIRTKSVKYMPLSLTLACLSCSVCWGIYSILLDDINVMVPNAAGFVSSIAQLILYGMYCERSTPCCCGRPAKTVSRQGDATDGCDQGAQGLEVPATSEVQDIVL